jgi:hypothetical protein
MSQLPERSVRNNVMTLRYSEISAGWEAWVMLSSDRHHDNIHTLHDLERKHLEKAKERNAIIVDVGDLFCAMQGKYDKRSNMDDIRQEHVGIDYLDRLVTTAAEFYGPYAKHFAVVGKGNHETSILRKHGTDLTSNFVHRLNADYGGDVAIGAYGGWVRFMFKTNKTMARSLKMKYFHGAGGGGPVTRGVIQTNRQAVYLPDADIVVNGHTHDQWHVPIARERLNNAGTVKRDIVHFVRAGTYKDEYGSGAGGWHVERWGAPKPLGCAWLHFQYDYKNVIKMDVHLDVS